MVRDLVGRIRSTGDDDHYRKLLRLPRLQVREGRQDGEDGNDYEFGPPWKGLDIPSKRRWAVTSVDDVRHVDIGSIREGERANCWWCTIRRVVGCKCANQGNGSRQLGCQCCKMMSGRRVEEKV